MRILVTGQTYYPGNNGQAIFTIHLAEGLVQAGHEVVVIHPANKYKYQKERINGVQIYRLNTIPFTWIHPEAFLTPFPGFKIRSILKEFRPDILHIQDHYFINCEGVRIARQMGIPVLGTNHFLPENLLPYIHWLPLPRQLKVAVLWRLMLLTYNLADMVTTPTKTAAKILSDQRIKAPVFPVSCGVDTNRFRPANDFDRSAVLAKWGLDPQALLFFYVGRLDREKRIDLLFKGFAHLLRGFSQSRDQNPIQLIVVGTGSARGELQHLADELGINTNVRFLGYVPAIDLPDVYRAGDVFCMPSPEELQSIATLEAMASGKPVLASNSRALPELVTSGTNGYLFIPGDMLSIVEGLKWFIERRSDWQSMGQVSRSRAVAHGIGNTIHQYEDMYKRLLDEKAPSRFKSSELSKLPQLKN